MKNFNEFNEAIGIGSSCDDDDYYKWKEAKWYDSSTSSSSFDDAHKKYVSPKKPDEEKKDKKVFNVGDKVICIKLDGKIPPDAVEFLKTYKLFTILQVTDKLSVDVGHKTEEGKPYYFSPNRFELKDKPKEIPKVEKEKEKEKPITTDYSDIVKKMRRYNEYPSYGDPSTSSYDAPRRTYSDYYD